MNEAAIAFAVPSAFLVFFAFVSNLRFHELKRKHKIELQEEYKRGFQSGLKTSKIEPKQIVDSLTGLIYPVKNS